MKFVKLVCGVLVLSCLSSCIVERPPYTKVEKVFTLNIGMTEKEVSEALTIPPYDLKSLTDTGKILIYKYRVTNRKTFPFLVKPTNGLKVNGKYIDLFVHYDSMNTVTKIESCSQCSETTEQKRKINVDKVITIVTAVVPSVLLFFGIRNN